MKITKNKAKRWLKEIIEVVIIVLLIRTFIITAYRIPTGSMENTLLTGDHLFACKFWYGLRIPFSDKRVLEIANPKRGDIIIFRYPYERKDFVKRCVAVANDIVEIKNKKLYVNGKEENHPYEYHFSSEIHSGLNIDKNEYQKLWEQGRFIGAGYAVRDNFGPVKVPQDHIFVMGDNRDYSFDSRYWGPLHKKWILGKPIILYFSWDSEPPIWKIWQKIRWKRLFHIIK